MLINEIFYSIQGEGSLSGTPSQFIRTSGCNLRCVWCDTPHTSWDSVGTSMTVDEIAEQVMDDIPHLVITGGAPLIQADLPKLISKLRRPERHITVETAGTIFTEAARPNLFSVSPKLSSSWPTAGGEREIHHRNLIEKYVPHYRDSGVSVQWKFVLDTKSEMREVLRFVEEYDLSTADVWLMPQATTVAQMQEKSEWVGQLCMDFQCNFSPRLQVDLWR